MRYKSLHCGLSKISFLRIPIILLVVIGRTALGAYLLFPTFLSVDSALLLSLIVIIFAAIKISSSFKSTPAEYLHFEGTDMIWSIEKKDGVHTQQISPIGLTVKGQRFDCIDIETPQNKSLTLHKYWSITQNKIPDASFCALLLEDDGGTMHGFKVLGKRTDSVGNIAELNIRNSEQSD